MPGARRQDWEGVEGLSVGRFDLGVNTRVCLYRFGGTLIDTGMPHAWPQVRPFVSERPLAQVLLTHHHEDHGGNAAAVAELTGAGIFAHREAVSALLQPEAMRLYQKVLFGRPAPCRAMPLPEEIRLDGSLSLVPIHTPGHSPDLVCYLQPDRGWLFSGDLYISSRPLYLREGEDLGRLMQSIRLLLGYSFSTVFCGHRGIVLQGQGAFREKLAYLEDLCGQARRLRDGGWPVSRITRKLLGREDMTSAFTGFNFTKKQLILGCLKVESPSERL